MIIHLHLAIYDIKYDGGHTSNIILPTLDVTRLNVIIHCIWDNKYGYHTWVRFEITTVEMDMSTPWLAREARYGLSISMIAKELRGNIESVL